MVPPPGQSGSHPLPQKEQALFKKIVKCYEHKQYKNGLKFAKQILSNPKFTDHGETLAMKGLILNCMGKAEEARENVKRGLTNDLKSHVCWHVYGLLQRSEKKYDDAIKAYRNALRIDKDNMQILRDLSLLQIQMRDLEGYRDTRYQLLTLRPTQRASWIGYAMSYHFLEDYDMALKILDEFRKTQNPTGYDFEHSELLLYQNMVLKEAGYYQEALKQLEENEDLICDKLSLMEIRGELYTRLNRIQEASEVYRGLIRRSTENLAYYRRLEECLGLCDEKEEILLRRLELYDEFRQFDPRASGPQRLPLSFLKGARFLERLKPYLMTGLRKGVPPLFNSIRNLYTDPNKVAVIEELLTRWASSLETVGNIPDQGGDSQMEQEVPTTVLWVYYFLAQHFDLLEKYEKAMEYVNRALEHTPTLIELLSLKAKIYKHAGHKVEAVRWIDEAQSFDTADRYVNSKCAKYMLRADLVTDAEIMCAKFTREGNNPMQSLNEMQCMWFETECARAYKRLGRLGDALKKCHEIERHFADIIEDQFDFHTYCVRKMTLCAYVRLIRLEDGLRKHRFYFRAAKCAIKIYLRLYDKPEETKFGIDGLNVDKMTPSEKRKLVRKKKKQAAKDQLKNQHQGQPQNKKPDPDIDHVPQEPLDPEVLLKTERPLEEAVKFLMPLIQLRCENIGAYALGFEVFFRKEKVLPMLQCLHRGYKLDPEDWKMHFCRVKFLKFLCGQSYEGPVKEILDEVVVEIFETRDPHGLNESFWRKHEQSLPHLLSVALSLFYMDERRQNEAVEIATSLEDGLTNRSWKNCKKVLKCLRNQSLGSVEERLVEDYRKKCEKLFPLALYFAPRTMADTNDHLHHNTNATDMEARMENSTHTEQINSQKIIPEGHQKSKIGDSLA